MLESITIEVDSETAVKYRTIPNAEREAIAEIIRFRLQRSEEEKKTSLLSVVDAIQTESERRGATEEVIEEVLRGEF